MIKNRIQNSQNLKNHDEKMLIFNVINLMSQKNEK